MIPSEVVHNKQRGILEWCNWTVSRVSGSCLPLPSFGFVLEESFKPPDSSTSSSSFASMAGARQALDSVGASSMLFLSRSLGGLVRPRSPPLGSGKVGVRPNPGRCPGPWVVERPASGQTPDGTPVPGGWNGRRPAKPQTLPPFLGGGTAGVRPNPGQGGRTGAN